MRLIDADALKAKKGLPVTHWMPLPDDPPWEEEDE